MKPRSFDEIIEEVARQLNTTPENARREMTEAMRSAMANPDPEVQAIWRKIAPDGKLPPLERFVEYIVLMAQEEK